MNSHKIFGANPVNALPYTKFLRVQTLGNSQSDLLNLANEIIQSQYGVPIDSFGASPRAYIYLDDCLFTGNRVRRDIITWLPNAIAGTTLHLIFFAVHTDGLDYSVNQIRQKAELQGVTVKYWRLHKFSNSRLNTQKFDCLWSSQFSGNELVDSYVQEVFARCRQRSFNPLLFRPNGVPTQETIFSSPAAREVVERAFLKAGAYIVSLPRNPNFTMRPLGYSYLESLGFGSIFMTYRNTANNCPLALWWGDTSFPSSHPFSRWYPLLPRKVNTSSSSWDNWNSEEF